MNASSQANPRLARVLGVVFWLVVAFALLPALAAWAVIGLGAALGCDPAGPGCRGLPLAALLRLSLDLAWGWAMGLGVVLGFAAALAAILLASLWRALVAGLLALVCIALPIAAVAVAAHEDCMVNEGGVGDCVIWGGSMGETFHAAAVIPWFAILAVPAAGVTLLVGLIGAVAVKINRRRRAARARAADALA